MSYDVMTDSRTVAGTATLGREESEHRVADQPLRRDRTARGVANDAPSSTQASAEAGQSNRVAGGPRPVTSVGVTPPGWYPDPAHPANLRWWTGVGWTEHTSSAASGEESSPAVNHEANARDHRSESTRPASPDPVAAETAPSRSARGAPPTVFTPLRPTRIHTVAIWVIAFAPLILAAGEYAIAERIVPQDPSTVRITCAIAVVILCWLLATVDRARLRNGWHSDTASPWWTLLTPFAYLIGRAVRVRQETGVRATGTVLVWSLMLLPAIAIAFARDEIASLIHLL